jgi:cell pole-organizing protein PopZ
MEEILASIRKIISDDASVAPATMAAPQPEHAAAEPEVLDLTHEIGDPPTMAANAPAASDLKPEETRPVAVSEASTVPSAETLSPPQPEPASPPQAEEGILSEKTRKALSNAFADIGPEAPESATEAHVETHAVMVAGIAGLSVEAVFERAIKETFDPVLQKWLAENNEALVERMKPVIRDWLDENLPTLLDEAIRNELSRAARPRGRR